MTLGSDYISDTGRVPALDRSDGRDDGGWNPRNVVKDYAWRVSGFDAGSEGAGAAGAEPNGRVV